MRDSTTDPDPIGFKLDMPSVYVTSAEVEGPVSEELQEKSLEKSPTRLAWEDVLLLFKRLPWLPDAVRPLGSATLLPGVSKPSGSVLVSYTITAIVTTLSIPALLAFVPAAILLPGWVVLLVYLGLIGLIALISKPTWGSFVLKSNVELPEPDKFPRERWIFINGIATSHVLMQTTIDMLSATFKRPIIGLHNRSWGIVGDILECLVQRAFRYHTQSVRISCEGIREALLDDNLDKVVIIAHSQGGIIVSLALDALYATLPTKHFKKLEIYTFGSAASSFHNPMIEPLDTDSSRPAAVIANASTLPDPARSLANSQPNLTRLKARPTFIQDHLVHFIEHYCNGRDIVPLWGVLWHIGCSSSSRYSGRVFKHERQTGHLFDQHYLQTMLPLLRIDDCDDETLFLNHVCTMNPREAGILKATTFPLGPGGGADGSVENATATAATKLRVRDLSRLWRYVDGRSP